MNERQTKDAIPFLVRLPLAQDRPWIGYAVAILLSAFATWLRMEIADWLPPGFPYLTFFPAVIITAFFFGLRPGILAAVLGFLAAWYWFIPPAGSFNLDFNTVVALAFYVFIVTVDVMLVHWMQSANCDLLIERRRTLELAENREMLFRELQHRVGNNLQMVSSLISLQKRKLTDDSAKAALDEASRRLGLVGRIHRQLYDPAGSQLSLAAYIDQISRDVIAASGRDNLTYAFDAQSDPALPADKAIPTALVVAEALNNAIEHGFGAGNGGHVIVTVAPAEEGVSVTIADDGKGLPDGFDLEASDSLGLRIARTLAQSLGGRFSMMAAPVGRGTVARLDISLAEPAAAAA